MSKLFKRILCVLFSSVMLASVILPANAAEILDNENCKEQVLTATYLEACTLEELYDLSHQVEKQENVNAVFEELLKRLSENQGNTECESVSTRSIPTTSALIDNYISVISASVTTSHVLTIVVNVKANIPNVTLFSFKLGYEYPATCRTEGTMLNMAGRSKGTYTFTISTKGLVSGIHVAADVMARDYKEHKHFATLFDRPYTTHVAYQTITQADVTLQKVVAIIPNVVLFFTPVNELGKLAQVTIKVFEGMSIVAALDVLTPDLAVGQYYKTTTTYTNNFECVVKVQVYSSKEAYDAGSSPIRTSNSTIILPH